MNKNISQKDYMRVMELFCVIHEELGEAQKAWNHLAWKSQGTISNVCRELMDIKSPLDALTRYLNIMWTKDRG